MIIRSLQGRTTAAEDSALQEWRRASPRNEEEYRAIAGLWMLTGHANLDQRAIAAPLAAVAAIARAVRRSDAASIGRQPQAPDTGPITRLAWRIAAAALLLAGGLAVGVSGVSWLRPGNPRFGVEEFVTGASQMVSAQLGDGSVVRLAPQSRLRITGGRDRRDLWLEGRAFFAVAKDARRPFVVHTAVGEAVALGTRFEVNVHGDALTLVMLQGRVALSANGARVEVNDGEVSAVAHGAAPTVVKMADVRPMLNWVGDFLAFEATPLAEAGTEIGHRYGVHVHVYGAVLKRRTVTAWFTDESLPEVVAAVCRVVDAQCTIDGSTVEIRPPELPPDRSRSRIDSGAPTAPPVRTLQSEERPHAVP